MDTISNLAEFFKHCLNVASNARQLSEPPPLWEGWTQCFITPYLTDGKYVHYIDTSTILLEGKYKPTFHNCLILTLEDYIEFMVARIYDTHPLVELAADLLDEIKIISSANLMSMIEKNSKLFPTQKDATHNNYLEESWSKLLEDNPPNLKQTSHIKFKTF